MNTKDVKGDWYKDTRTWELQKQNVVNVAIYFNVMVEYKVQVTKQLYE